MVGYGFFEKCGRYDFWSTELQQIFRLCGNIKEFNIQGILAGPIFDIVNVGASTRCKQYILQGEGGNTSFHILSLSNTNYVFRGFSTIL
jgi:hypothetical protein